jgi:hypothetical protein
VAVGRELPGIENDEVRFVEACQLHRCGSDQHGVHEEGVIWARANNSDLKLMSGIPTGKSVKTIERLTRVQVVDSSLSINIEDGGL